jgi:hypothetical protein
MIVRLSEGTGYLRTRIGRRLLEMHPGATYDVPSQLASQLIERGRAVKGSYPDIRNDAVVEVDLRGVPQELLPASAQAAQKKPFKGARYKKARP